MESEFIFRQEVEIIEGTGITATVEGFLKDSIDRPIGQRLIVVRLIEKPFGAEEEFIEQFEGVTSQVYFIPEKFLRVVKHGQKAKTKKTSRKRT